MSSQTLPQATGTPRAQALRIAIVVLMLAAAAALAAHWLTPTRFLAQERPVQLQTAIPEAFGDWRIDRYATQPLTNPAANALSAKLYSQILERTYIGPQGQRVMLSIAYGPDQRDALQVHRPEFCYTAQGYQIKSSSAVNIPTARGSIPARQLWTQHGQRVEPLTYWTTLGERNVVASGMQKRRAEIHYALQGLVGDGLVFRVSSLGSDVNSEWMLQQKFIRDLIEQVSRNNASVLAGI